MSLPDLSGFRNKRLLIVGDIMLDEFLHVISTRMSPEYKEAPVYDVRERQTYPGGAANVAMNIKSLEAIPYLVGITGNDAAGNLIGQLLEASGISTEYIFTSSRRKTAVKTRVLNNGNPVARIDEEVNTDLAEPESGFLIKNIRQAINDHKPHAIILQDYDKGVLNAETIPQILSIAKEHHIPVSVDPKFKNWENYQNVELFKPNKNELKVMSCELRAESEDLKTIAQKLEEKIHFRILLVTLGSEGNFIYNNSGSNILNSTFIIPEADVCGAGDSVIAAATLGLACGFSLEAIAELANKAGYIACTKKHVQPVSLHEILSTKY